MPINTTTTTYEREKPQLMNELRKVLADMTMEIRNFSVRPLKSSERHVLRPFDQFDDELERGMQFYHNELVSLVVVTDIKYNGSEISALNGGKLKGKRTNSLGVATWSGLTRASIPPPRSILLTT